MMRLFFITGHGRSGTNYMSALFQYLGHDVGRQGNGSAGIAHNFPSYWPPEKLREHYQYLIQVVRNPYKVVESTYLADYSLPSQNSNRIPEIGCAKTNKTWGSKGRSLTQSIRSVVLWNRAIRNAKPDLVVQVENALSVCKQWLIDNGLKEPLKSQEPETNINHRDGNKGWDLTLKVPWDDLPQKELNMFKKHCKEYGYAETSPET